MAQQESPRGAEPIRRREVPVTTDREGKLPLFERYRAPVDHFMKSLTSQVAATGSTPAKIAEYHLGFRNHEGTPLPEGRPDGKEIRPTLCLLTADAISQQNSADNEAWRSAVPAAAALELFHNFTLVHDDIMDGDKTRHGRPTVWAIHGVGQAINAGDDMHVMSHEAIGHLRDEGYPAETVLKAFDLMTDASHQLTEGQAKDMEFEKRLDVTEEEYLAMIRGKTGILIETSVAMGAILGGADEKQTALLREFGRSSGLAFQLVDDWLGIWGDPEKTGKPVGGDIRRRKKSYPVVVGFEQADGEQKTTLERIYRKESDLDDSEVATVLGILGDLGVKERTIDKASEALGTAMTAINTVNIFPEFKADYMEVIAKFAQRDR
jgi:geranylgeranyl diphosphate synthase type I